MYKTLEFNCSPYNFPKQDAILCFNQFAVEERIELPQHKPNMEKIVDSKVTVEIESFKLIDTPKGKKVFIRGILEQEILYVVESLCQPVHAFHSAFPFCTFINLWDCGISDFTKLENIKPNIIVEYMETIQICPRTVRKCILLFAWYPKGIVVPPHPPHPIPPPKPEPPPHPVPTPQPIQIIQECHLDCKPKTISPKPKRQTYAFK